MSTNHLNLKHLKCMKAVTLVEEGILYRNIAFESEQKKIQKLLQLFKVTGNFQKLQPPQKIEIQKIFWNWCLCTRSINL